VLGWISAICIVISTTDGFLKDWNHNRDPKLGLQCTFWCGSRHLNRAVSVVGSEKLVQFTWWYAVVEGVLNSFEFQSGMTAIQYELGHFTAPLHQSHQLHGWARLRAEARILPFLSQSVLSYYVPWLNAALKLPTHPYLVSLSRIHGALSPHLQTCYHGVELIALDCRE